MRIFGCKDCEYSLSIKDKYCLICKTDDIPHKDINTPKPKKAQPYIIDERFRVPPKKKITPTESKRRRLFKMYPECLSCGTKENLTIDHVIPKSKGGSNSLDNLQTLCKKCNGEKSDNIRDYRMGAINNYYLNQTLE